MTKNELIEYWVSSSDRDFKTMENLILTKDYAWALFIGHLIIEKLLKAYYVKTVSDNPPWIHQLLRLAEKTDLSLTEEQKDDLVLITTFNINVRYPDYKHEFYQKCTKEYTETNISKIKELQVWLKKQILK
ncbi:HEPN domain-containing protein [bacterium]|nr:HEPN domain-containing protein [bacterium]MBU1152535.1 HEPN domain-containing protein [bacterium]